MIKILERYKLKCTIMNRVYNVMHQMISKLWWQISCGQILVATTLAKQPMLSVGCCELMLHILSLWVALLSILIPSLGGGIKHVHYHFHDAKLKSLSLRESLDGHSNGFWLSASFEPKLNSIELIKIN